LLAAIKMQKLTLIFLLSVLFSFCGLREKEGSKLEKDIRLNDIKEGKDPSFDEFLQRFNQDSGFQLSRVHFPLRGKVLNLSGSGPETINDTIYVSEYRIKDFTYDEKDPGKFDFTRNIHIQGDQATIQVAGKENGLSANYTFRRIKGKWMLVTFEDYST
jgi:hypothetical protein